MGNEMGNNNTSGILHESDDATTEVQEKSLQQPVRVNNDKGKNHVVPASENKNIDEKETVLASNDSNGSGDDQALDKTSNGQESNVTDADPPAANHKTEMSVDEAGNNEDSEIQSNSLAKELEDHEKPTELISVSDENRFETSHNKLQKHVSFTKESYDATTEAQEKSLQQPVCENDEKEENHIVPATENKNMDEKETVLPSKDSNGTGDDHASSNASDVEELNVTEADPPVENHKTETSVDEAGKDEDSEIQSTSLPKELEFHEKPKEPVSVSDQDHLETNQKQLQKQASIRKAEEDGMLTGSCVTTSQLQNSEPQVLERLNSDQSKLTEIDLKQSEQRSSNFQIKEDGVLGSSIASSPVKENGHHIDTYLTNNTDGTVVFGSGTGLETLDDEKKKEELTVTEMASQEEEIQFEETSDEIGSELSSATILSSNSASDDAEKFDGKLTNEIKSQENNSLELHPEANLMADSLISLEEGLPEDKCIILTEETKLVKDSETEENKQYHNYAQSNEELVIESKTDETNVTDTDFLLSPDCKTKEKEEPHNSSCDPVGVGDFQKQANVADSGYCIETSEENSKETEGENVIVTELGMLPLKLSIPCGGEYSDDKKDCKIKEGEPEEIKEKPEAASVNEKEKEESENIERLMFQSIPVHSEQSPSDSLIQYQDSQQENAIGSNTSQSFSSSTLKLKPESCSELADTKPSVFHSRSMTVEFFASAVEFAVEKPMQVAVNCVSVNAETVLETKSSSSPYHSIDRYEVETSLLSKDGSTEAAESVSRSSTESNPNGFNVQIRKSPSFNLDLREEERSGESDKTPLLYQDKTKIKSSQADTTKYVQESLGDPTMEVEEKVITLERSDSEKSGTPFLGFLKQDEEDRIVVTPKKQVNQGAPKNGTIDSCKSVTKEVSSSPAKHKDKHNKRRSSLFTNCMCCTTVIN